MRTCWILLFCIVKAATGSAGDYDWQFISCSRKCVSQYCSSADQLAPSALQAAVFHHSLHLVSHNCDEVCDFKCMNIITEERRRQGLGPLKYFGHWPFTRWLGLEEPASAVFSLLNIIPHIVFLARRHCLPQQYRLRLWVQGYALVSVNAWVASACYHAKKSEHSTAYDLISALALLCFGVALVSSKLADHLRASAPRAASWLQALIVSMLGIFWTHRTYRMLHREISFGVHMEACMALAGLATVLWVIWIALAWSAGQKSTVLWCILVQGWFVSAALLEVFDFPPFAGLLDAHSLWHLATVPLGFLWYEFWRRDALDSKQALHKGKNS